jgi:REP element-mobilizing transposase RayT
MHAYLAAMFRNYNCETLIVGGVEDHTHSLFALSRNHSIATVVKEAKRTSSGWVKEKSPKLASFHWQAARGR